MRACTSRLGFFNLQSKFIFSPLSQSCVCLGDDSDCIEIMLGFHECVQNI